MILLVDKHLTVFQGNAGGFGLHSGETTKSVSPLQQYFMYSFSLCLCSCVYVVRVYVCMFNVHAYVHACIHVCVRLISGVFLDWFSPYLLSPGLSRNLELADQPSLDSQLAPEIPVSASHVLVSQAGQGI